jgi:flagellar assembly protein FliH
LSKAAVSYAFEQLAPSDPVSPDGLAQLVAQATAQAEDIRESARAQGYSDGHAAGQADGLAEVSSAALALGEANTAVQALLYEVSTKVERDAVELALALAEKILAGALQAKPELVLTAVQGALRRITDRRRITVLVNPADLQIVQTAVGDLQAQGNGVELCDVQVDPRVQPGGAIVRTAEGEVDASVQTQLERAREVIFAELETSEPAA